MNKNSKNAYCRISVISKRVEKLEFALSLLHVPVHQMARVGCRRFSEKYEKWRNCASQNQGFEDEKIYTGSPVWSELNSELFFLTFRLMKTDWKFSGKRAKTVVKQVIRLRCDVEFC